MVAAYFPSRTELQRTFLFNNFSQSALGFTRKVIGRFEHRIWSDYAYVFYGWHIDFKRHFKTVLISQRFFVRGCGFYFLDSFSFGVGFLVLCFVKVKKRGVCCKSTYLANRKGDYDCLLWRRKAGFEVVELKQLEVSPQKSEVLCY